jgi:RNA polymerase sigma-70 factor (ECF subfamily)
MISGPELSSLQALSEQHAARLRRDLEAAVASLCPPSLADRREDLVQDALLKVAQIVARSEPDPAEPELNATYLWRTAYSALVDELRRIRRRAEVNLDEAGPAETLASPHPGPADSSRSVEIRRALIECLNRLIEARRLAVILHLQGERPREAAELLGWPRKRVHNLTFRGIRDLRRCLAAQGMTP